MNQPFVGEIIMFGGNFAPNGWAFCNGAILPIDQFQTLFQLIGTTYGGDGQTTFALPDLQGRMPMHQGNNGTSNYTIGQRGGTETITLTTSQLPSHTHVLNSLSTNGNSKSPVGATIPAFVAGTNTSIYSAAATDSNMVANNISNGGGSQPHENRQPTLAISFCISLFGIFPSQN